MQENKVLRKDKVMLHLLKRRLQLRLTTKSKKRRKDRLVKAKIDSKKDK